MKQFLKFAVVLACILGTQHFESLAGTVTFGNGANAFSMEFVAIGNPGNAPQFQGTSDEVGAVGYTFDIGKFEVNRDMIEKYNAASENAALQITMSDLSSYGGNGANKPATGVSWNEAARFINWLNTSTGGTAAYNFISSGVDDNIEIWTASDTLDYDPANPFRSKRAKYALPHMDEIHKAAYYNPVGGVYYNYATGSNSTPIAVSSGTAQFTAVYNQLLSQGPAEVDNAGALSPYGVMALNGNVREWEESPNTRDNYNGNSLRAYQSGGWSDSSVGIRNTANPKNGFGSGGFRVVMLTPSNGGGGEVPEPSTFVIGSLFGLGAYFSKKRRKTRVSQ
ncbi:MAG: hypothetical protein RL240_30 [Planctomycetota bacterium]|jgi:formylglycine-generating enzyme required for sulfatase activity